MQEEKHVRAHPFLVWGTDAGLSDSHRWSSSEGSALGDTIWQRMSRLAASWSWRGGWSALGYHGLHTRFTDAQPFIIASRHFSFLKYFFLHEIYLQLKASRGEWNRSIISLSIYECSGHQRVYVLIGCTADGKHIFKSRWNRLERNVWGFFKVQRPSALPYSMFMFLLVYLLQGLLLINHTVPVMQVFKIAC